jgi:hypothetical protein
MGSAQIVRVFIFERGSVVLFLHYLKTQSADSNQTLITYKSKGVDICAEPSPAHAGR